MQDKNSEYSLKILCLFSFSCNRWNGGQVIYAIAAFQILGGL